jgi:glycosyltransferase involved in cell wall biosynthesis
MGNSRFGNQIRNKTADERQLTIVIPVHKMAGRLENLNKSIKSAADCDVTFILVNDESDDATFCELVKIVEENAFADIKLMTGKFGSPGMARNAGLEQVATNFVMFADSDDEFFVSKILSVISSVNAQLIIGSFEVLDFSSQNLILNRPKKPLTVTMAISPGIWRLVLNTNIAKLQKFSKYRMGEDQLWMAELLLLDLDFVVSNEVFYRYYSSNPLSLTSNPEAIQDLESVLREFEKLLKRSGSHSRNMAIYMYLKIWIPRVKTLDSSRKFRAIIKFGLVFIKKPLLLPHLLFLGFHMIKFRRLVNVG